MKVPVVYFVQPKGGGPIKVGKTVDIGARVQGLGGWSPGGLELLATIPGSDVREAALKWLFAPRLWNATEWFAADATIWRTIIEAQECGDLAWLPAEPPLIRWHDRVTSREVYDEALSYFGTREELARRLGYELCSVGGLRSICAASPNLVARLQIEKLRDRRQLPDRFLPPCLSDAEAA